MSIRRRFVDELDDVSIEQVLRAANSPHIRRHLRAKLRRGLDDLTAKGILDKWEIPPYFDAPVKCKPPQPHDVFVCHSSKDKRFARRLAKDLKLKGFKVWFDEFEMLPGDSLHTKIQQGIRYSAWFVIVLSPNSVASAWCERELHSAFQEELERKRVYVVPVLYKQCEIPIFLKEKFWADCNRRNYKQGVALLVKRFSKVRRSSRAYHAT